MAKKKMATDTAPYVSGSDTSRAAADSLTDDLGRLEALVYKLIGSSGLQGRTDDELEVSTQLAHQTISARRRTLVLKGHVCDSGHRRRTRSGRQAVVWILGTDPTLADKPLAERPHSDGQAVVKARRLALEEAATACHERAKHHTGYTDKAEALGCEHAIRQLMRAEPLPICPNCGNQMARIEGEPAFCLAPNCLSKE